jgi:hypothetical protein
MGVIGKISGEPFSDKAKFGDSDVRYASVQFPLPDDIRTVEILSGAGEDSSPMAGDVVVVETIGGILVAAAGQDSQIPALKTGEREFYSRDADGNKIARVTLLNTGEIDIESIKGEAKITLDKDGNIAVKGKSITEDGDSIKLNGDSKSFVTYAELNQALQQLWTAVQTHGHMYAPGPSPPVTTGPSLDLASVMLDISASETKTVKTGG